MCNPDATANAASSGAGAKKKEELQPAATAEHGLSPTLIRARADYEHSSFRAWAFVVLCTASFYIGPFLLLSPLFVYLFHPRAAGTIFCANIFLAFYPVGPWKTIPKLCQLFYSVFDFHHNLTPRLDELAREGNRLSIIAMHPHAIIPLHGFVWAAICDQVLPHMYGYGCTTDGALVLPVLRHLLYWISAGSARKKKVLHEMQTRGRNLFILPGGVAEIFLSRRRPSGDASLPVMQTIKARRYGLMKLALETGAAIYPAFVFGISDVLDQLAHVDDGDDSPSGPKDEVGRGANRTIFGGIGKVLQSASRKVGGGLTLFYGRYGLPIPYNPRLSLVMGDPILPVEGEATMRNVRGEKRTCVRVESPTAEQVEELMGRYTDALRRLFEQYKAEAGYPNDTLRII